MMHEATGRRLHFFCLLIWSHIKQDPHFTFKIKAASYVKQKYPFDFIILSAFKWFQSD